MNSENNDNNNIHKIASNFEYLNNRIDTFDMYVNKRINKIWAYLFLKDFIIFILFYMIVK